MFREATAETNALLNLAQFAHILQRSKGKPAQMQHATNKFQTATRNIPAINETVYSEIIRDVFMIDRLVVSPGADDSNGVRPHSSGQGGYQTMANQGTFGSAKKSNRPVKTAGSDADW
mmetsp:Transcript_14081/g.22373  ORF Transcript_14081/g.22373 Transcript_14081/m.22373 type:complete len:118 (+) Transcript_14081:278-631(+)